MEHIDLSKNQLEGSIPVAIEGWTNLKHINLSHNLLSGSIPDKELWNAMNKSLEETTGDPVKSLSLESNRYGAFCSFHCCVAPPVVWHAVLFFQLMAQVAWCSNAGSQVVTPKNCAKLKKSSSI